MQVKICYRRNYAKEEAGAKWRSGCPLNASVEILGDRGRCWIIRDMMLRGFQSYKESWSPSERIATNILADRLRKLVAHGIITSERIHRMDEKLITCSQRKESTLRRCSRNGPVGSRARRYR